MIQKSSVPENPRYVSQALTAHSLAPVSHEFDSPTTWADADARETIGNDAIRWARPLRILIETAVGVVLLTALISLLTNVVRPHRNVGLQCPFGTSQAVMATTGCQIVLNSDTFDRN